MKKFVISFKKALNPASKHSGIYCLDEFAPYNPELKYSEPPGKEIVDDTVLKSIAKAYHDRLGFFPGVKATYDIITGRHYEQLKVSQKENGEPKNTHSKGVLDYLIFPLVARAMLHKTEGPQKEKAPTTAIFGPFVLLFEVARLSTGIVLTTALTPTIGAVQIVQSLGGDSSKEAKAAWPRASR